MRMENVKIAFSTMIIRLLALGFALWPGAAQAATSQDAEFLAAREAFRIGDAVRFERYAKSLDDYILEPYVAYWRLRLRLENATPADVQALLARIADVPASSSLRADWLKLLGNRQQWDLFDAEFPRLAEEDTELGCFALQSRIRADADGALRAARTVWFSGRDLPDSCSALFDALVKRGRLTEDDIWARIRLALEAGNTGVARRVAEYLPANERPDVRTLARIAVNAQAFLDKKGFNLRTRAGREVVMFAAHRLARTAPQLAAQHWTRLGEQFSETERGYVWGLIASLGAQRHDPDALAWYALAGELDDTQLAWKVRAALRAQSWADVPVAVAAMSAQERQNAVWRYWKARALKVRGRIAEAQALFTPLASEFSFYGQLAAEELGVEVRIPAIAYSPGDAEVQVIGARPGIQRALAFYRLDLRYEGNREWIRAIRGFDDRQLLAAAEFARRVELYDRAINTAEQTVQSHDFSLRFLAPYRELIREYAVRQQLDEAWVYGLIRQESRFIVNARSSSGAMGLMQLMPATARWVAGKIGLADYFQGRIGEVRTNINLGTWYMRHMLDLYGGHPVLASAAYNAGPNRARSWRSDAPMEAAIYAETIPVFETRDYVRKVMSNAGYYGQMLGHPPLSLKDRIGMIFPRQRAAEKPLDEPGG